MNFRNGWYGIFRHGNWLGREPIRTLSEAERIREPYTRAGFETKIERCGPRGIHYCVKIKEQKNEIR